MGELDPGQRDERVSPLRRRRAAEASPPARQGRNGPLDWRAVEPDGIEVRVSGRVQTVEQTLGLDIAAAAGADLLLVGADHRSGEDEGAGRWWRVPAIRTALIPVIMLIEPQSEQSAFGVAMQILSDAGVRWTPPPGS